MNLIASKNPEFQALRQKSQALAFLWSAGHAAFFFSFLAILAAVEMAVAIQMEWIEISEPSRWPLVGAFLFVAAVCLGGGRLLMRHALRKALRGH